MVPAVNTQSAPPIGDGNSPWNEAFAFRSLEEYGAFRAVHPELFDRQADARELVRRWKAFARTSAGRSLRWR